MLLTIELLNENALNLLIDLERLNIIRVMKKDVEKSDKIIPSPPPQGKKKRFAGRISKQTAADLQNQLNQTRAEWKI